MIFKILSILSLGYVAFMPMAQAQDDLSQSDVAQRARETVADVADAAGDALGTLQNLIPEGALPAEEPALTDMPSAPQAQLDQAYTDIGSAAIDADVFFDAENLIPESELSRSSSISRVDPSVQPASRFIVVEDVHDADSIESRLIAAKRAFDLQRFQAALRIYTELEAKHPKEPSILLGKAAALQSIGRDDDAVKAYNAALDLDPDNVDAHVNMLGLVSEQYPAVALQRLLNLRNEHADKPAIMAQIAFVQARMGRYEEALDTYALVAAQDPNNAQHYFQMAIVADRAGQPSQAVNYYEKALSVDTVYGGGRTIPRDIIFDRLARLR